MIFLLSHINDTDGRQVREEAIVFFTINFITLKKLKKKKDKN